MKTLGLSVFLAAFAATQASANWTYNADVDPAGRGVGMGNGINMILECGNGGLPAIGLHGHNPGGPQEDFVLQIDGNPEDIYFGDCVGAFCWLDMDTMERAQSFWNQLRTGATLEVGLLRRGSLGSVPLNGVSSALSQIEARGCGF